RESVGAINTLIILGRPFLATGRAPMDWEKHEIKFRVNDDEITLKARRENLFPKSYGNISVVVDVDVYNDPTKLGGKVALKKKKSKSKWVKHYFCGSEGRMRMRKSCPRDDSSMG
ncbi:hypothetical protein HAX54_052998, partial [Datura stramonium]|nr:hypothetical protein [Datura stramonium]